MVRALMAQCERGRITRSPPPVLRRRSAAAAGKKEMEDWKREQRIMTRLSGVNILFVPSSGENWDGAHGRIGKRPVRLLNVYYVKT